MKENLLRRLYVDELKDLYSAENRLVTALPERAKAASSRRVLIPICNRLNSTLPGWKRFSRE
jgi:ferritin-like metal-binding protein YciE